MDEISYRVVLIGFPMFTLGGLFFAMIWAQTAWGRFWGWRTYSLTCDNWIWYDYL